MAEATLIRHSRIYGVLALFAVLIGACAVWLRIDVERQHVAAKTARASMVAAARELVVALYEQNGVRDESELTEAWLTNIAAERLASGQWRVQIARDWQETMRSIESCDSDAPFLMITRVAMKTTVMWLRSHAWV